MSHDIKNIWIQAEKYKEKCLETKQLQTRLKETEGRLAAAEEALGKVLEPQRLRDTSMLASYPAQNGAVWDLQNIVRAYFEKYGENK